MASPKALATVAWVALLLECAVAATITVGAPGGGWDLNTDLSAWAASQTFSVGDTLVFQYGPTHDVLEVTKTNYDACQASSPIANYSGGNTPITLSTPGKRFFICGVGNHCNSGMKLEVDVSGASPPTSSPPATPPVSSPPPSRTPSPTAPSASPPTRTKQFPPAWAANPPLPPSPTPSPAAPSALPPTRSSPVTPTAAVTPSPPTTGSVPPPPNSAAVGLKAPATATMAFLFWLLMLLPM